MLSSNLEGFSSLTLDEFRGCRIFFPNLSDTGKVSLRRKEHSMTQQCFFIFKSISHGSQPSPPRGGQDSDSSASLLQH